MYLEGEVPYVAGNCNNANNGFGFGNGWEGLIGLALVAGLFGGWGGNGFGFGGNGGAINGYATQADIQRGFDTQSVLNKLNGIESGLCDGFYAQNTNMLNGFAGVQQTLCQGFSGVNTSITTNGYETRSAITDLGYRFQDCCCQTQRAIDGVNYNMAKNTCDIIRAGQDNTRQILDFLTQDKIATLQAENSTLTAQLSQNAQTSTIINTLRPTPTPAYITCSPYQSVFGYGLNNGCNGCGSF